MSYVQDLRKYLGHEPLILNGSCVLLFNDRQQLLLQQRAKPQQRWGLLGGLMELGEATDQVVIREVREESGLQLMPSQLNFFKIYSGASHRSVAPNGDVFYSVIAAYVYSGLVGTPHIADQESRQFRWFDLDQLPTNLVDSHREIITDYLASQ